MDDGKLGLPETVSMAIGGMVGGGIFAVLGVVAGAASTLAWLAFVVAGSVAACAGYSFNRLNGLADDPGGPIAFVEDFTGRTAIAGMVGWTFIFGYVGLLALRERSSLASTVVPAVGVVGAAATVVALFWHLWSAERGVFGSVVLIAVAVLAVELLYFERAAIEREVEQTVTRSE